MNKQAIDYHISMISYSYSLIWGNGHTKPADSSITANRSVCLKHTSMIQWLVKNPDAIYYSYIEQARELKITHIDVLKYEQIL